MSCKSVLLKSSENIVLTNKLADLNTKYLFSRISEIPKTGYAFGHQDATAYGMGWKYKETEYRSDVKDVAGDYPAIYGFELGHLEKNAEVNLDTVNFKTMSKLIKKAHQDGGIITLSWHPDNPLTKKSAWDPTATLPMILKGGLLHPKYRAWLSKIATFMNQLKTDDGQSIPIVFRPFHEMNGSWFWWGKDSCTPEEFKQLWRQTFTLLTETFKVNNLLYCYATDVVVNKNEYLKYYPGDDYVDVLGIDLYQKGSTEDYKILLDNNLSMLANIAKAKGKPFALSEGGLERLPIEDWWTKVLDENVRNIGLSWVLVWRNAWESHFYAPYPGHSSAEDFKKFKSLEHVFFLEEIRKIK